MQGNLLNLLTRQKKFRCCAAKKDIDTAKRIKILYEIFLTGVIFLITPELLARINELARKKRKVGLSAEEAAEQKRLYDIYLTEIRGQVTDLLDHIEFADAPAKPVKKKKKILRQQKIDLERVIH